MTAKKPDAKGPGKPGPVGVRVDLPSDKYAIGVRLQKKWIRALADDIEAGKPLAETADRQAVAAILRGWADSVSEQQKGKQGPAPKFDHGWEAFSYAIHRRKGWTHGQALAEIADRVGVSEVAVDKAIRKYRAAAFAFFGFPDPGN